MTTSTDSPTFRHLKLFVNGVLLHVAVGGTGPALLLLHGWLGSSYSWRKVMPALAEHFTVIVPDARGYGDSAKPEGRDPNEAVALQEESQRYADALFAEDCGEIECDLLDMLHHPDSSFAGHLFARARAIPE